MASYYEKKEFELQKLKDDENKKSQPKNQKVTNYIGHDGNRCSTYSRRGKSMMIAVRIISINYA